MPKNMQNFSTTFLFNRPNLLKRHPDRQNDVDGNIASYFEEVISMHIRLYAYAHLHSSSRMDEQSGRVLNSAMTCCRQ